MSATQVPLEGLVVLNVKAASEPPAFEDRVRAPGIAYLETVGAKGKPDYRNREYWRRCLDDLYAAYGGVCAYTCHWIPLDTGSDTVEHFVPKSINSKLAYEWSNYRLVCGRMNGRKGDNQDVLDPFKIADGIFELQFPSLDLKINAVVAGKDMKLAKSTIERLKLNDDRCVRSRFEWLRQYAEADLSLRSLRRMAPLLAREVARQGYTPAKLRDVLQLA